MLISSRWEKIRTQRDQEQLNVDERRREDMRKEKKEKQKRNLRYIL